MIRQWVDEAHGSPICWLQGPAGSGKSAIAQTVAEEYDKSQELVASFFLGRRRGDQSEITNFVPTIVFQLSMKVPQTKALMQKAFEREPSIANQSPKYQFRKLVIDPLLELAEAPSRRFLVVVDGLDQCDKRRVEELIVLLADACQNNRLHLRFCLTSRIDVPTGTLPEDFVSRSRIFFLALETFDARDDIRIFFKAAFKEIHGKNRTCDMQNVPEPWPSHSDVDQLVGKSSGLFIFACMIMKFVDDDGSNKARTRLQAVLTSLDDHRDATSTCSHNVRDPFS